jgi:hypothetical protein
MVLFMMERGIPKDEMVWSYERPQGLSSDLLCQFFEKVFKLLSINFGSYN